MSEQRDHPDRSGFGTGVDLRADGVLWYINEHLFHPLGYALAFNPDVKAEDATPERPQFMLLCPDGEPIRFESSLNSEGRDLRDLAERAMRRARETLYTLEGSPIRPVRPTDAAGD